MPRVLHALCKQCELGSKDERRGRKYNPSLSMSNEPSAATASDVANYRPLDLTGGLFVCTTVA